MTLVEIGTDMGKSLIGRDLFPSEVEAGFLRALGYLNAKHRSRVYATKQNSQDVATADWIKLLRNLA